MLGEEKKVEKKHVATTLNGLLRVTRSIPDGGDFGARVLVDGSIVETKFRKRGKNIMIVREGGRDGLPLQVNDFCPRGNFRRVILT